MLRRGGNKIDELQFGKRKKNCVYVHAHFPWAKLSITMERRLRTIMKNNNDFTTVLSKLDC